MNSKPLPFDQAFIEELRQRFPTPFYIYDEAGIRKNARRLMKAFSWCEGFQEYYAVKAAPNPHILKILHEEGCGADCSSMAELLLSQRVGIEDDKVFFTSNNTPASEFQQARRQNAIINLDDISHIDFLDQHAGLPESICFRFNPGPERTGNAIIGDPKEAKYGFTREQLMEGYAKLKDRGVKRFGLHAMVASNELNPTFFVETARMLFQLACEIQEKTGVRLEFTNLGGGMGIPYKPEDKPLDLEEISAGVQRTYDEIIKPAGLDPLRICLENGRIMTGPYAYLISEVIHHKDIYKKYVGVDACMANLMRPGLYGAYHHITVLGKEDAPATETVDVVGSLCENNDKFAIDRKLPPTEAGDLIAIHDVGAHGHAMGFQYNGKLRSAELLLKEDGTVEQIRRAETLDDYFATLDFDSI